VVLFKLLSIDPSLLPNLGLWDSLTVIWIKGFVTILRTVNNIVTFDVTTSASVCRWWFFVSGILKLLLVHHGTHVVKLCCRVCIHLLITNRH